MSAEEPTRPERAPEANSESAPTTPGPLPESLEEILGPEEQERIEEARTEALELVRAGLARSAAKPPEKTSLATAARSGHTLSTTSAHTEHAHDGGGFKKFVMPIFGVFGVFLGWIGQAIKHAPEMAGGGGSHSSGGHAKPKGGGGHH